MGDVDNDCLFDDCMIKCNTYVTIYDHRYFNLLKKCRLFTKNVNNLNWGFDKKQRAAERGFLFFIFLDFTDITITF